MELTRFSVELAGGVTSLVASCFFAFVAMAEPPDATETSKQEPAESAVSGPPPMVDGPAERETQPGEPPVDSDFALLSSLPPRGNPPGRQPGTSRSASRATVLRALVPDHLAYTTAAEPAIFWHLERLPGSNTELFFTLIDPNQIKPIAEVAVSLPKQPGVQRLRLNEYEIHLAQDVDYEWSVALVVDPQRRSRDEVAFGRIRRVAEPNDPVAGGVSPSVNAKRGFWYDALGALYEARQQAPSDKSLKAQWSSLLRRAGLDDELL